MRQIEELYHSACDRDPTERVAFLLEACGSDEGLRREVESLLAEHIQRSPLDERPEWDAGSSRLESIAKQLAPGGAVRPL